MKKILLNTRNYFARMQKISMKDYFSDWTLWEKSWLVISTIVILIASIMTWDSSNLPASYSALISSITGIWCVLLVAKCKISNYIFGFLNAAIYAYAAFSWKLYGDFMLNAFYFLPMQVYGWYIWTKPEFLLKKDTVKVKQLSLNMKLFFTIISIVSVVIYGFILKKMGGVTPYFDSASTVLSIIAMILMAKLYMEQWVLWIIVDIVTVYMWWNIVVNEGGMMNLGVLIMWVAWLINAIYGFVNWLKMIKNQKG